MVNYTRYRKSTANDIIDSFIDFYVAHHDDTMQPGLFKIGIAALKYSKVCLLSQAPPFVLFESMVHFWMVSFRHSFLRIWSSSNEYTVLCMPCSPVCLVPLCALFHCLELRLCAPVIVDVALVPIIFLNSFNKECHAIDMQNFEVIFHIRLNDEITCHIPRV